LDCGLLTLHEIPGMIPSNYATIIPPLLLARTVHKPILSVYCHRTYLSDDLSHVITNNGAEACTLYSRKLSLGRCTRRWENNIIICESVDWIQMAQYTIQRRALVNTIMNFRVLQKLGNFLTSQATVSFSKEKPCSVKLFSYLDLST
jgi:hypothetical protein